jgi:hypothetical protein
MKKDSPSVCTSGFIWVPKFLMYVFMLPTCVDWSSLAVPCIPSPYSRFDRFDSN